MGVAVEFDVDGTRYLSLGLSAMQRHFGNTRQLMQTMGAAVESQTRRRIADEKTGPDGRRWKPWSARYARTRHANHSLLVNEGHLLNSIRWALLGSDAVTIGTNLAYGPVHQFGVGVPARPFLDPEFDDEDNRNEIDLILQDWLDRGGDVAARYGGRDRPGRR